MDSIQLQAIGYVHSPLKTPVGSPIQPRFAEGIEATIEVLPQYAEALVDLDGFDRIWLLYWFNQAPPAKLTVKPFKDNVTHGLFATRAPCRPNPIGISSVRLLGVDGNILRIGDVDILDATPILDIKPYAPQFDHYTVERSGWLDTANDRTAADDRFENKG